ncbi:COGs COG3146 [plant metagenome]|uniref:COGs COG3146 n=1 Tax=plant metagenome TaxID=1297885 RepID=A0A484P4U1_9ZZZZ
MADDTPRYRLQIIDSLAEVDAADWDALAATAGCLLSHAFLHGLEATGCVGEGTGWLPRHVLLRDEADGSLAGAVPLYLKGHSYGEYVFDWAWAEAYERHGLRYYPKWLSAIPFTPVGGTRLLARDTATRDALARALPAIAEESGLSSLHVLFPREDEARALAEAGCMLRADTQFHWRNAGWSGFEDFLASLSQPKRKKIRAERRKVQEAGVSTRVVSGGQITPEQWAFFYTCYTATYRLRGNDPYLTPAFFTHLGQALPEHCVMALAERDGRQIAACLLLSDIVEGERRLYGRYWGAVADVPCLHFELSYYTPIAWAIAQGVSVIEGGAQGEHKLARGFLPVPTRSAHWLAHPAFAQAVEDFLERESRGVEAYVAELGGHSPFKHGA